MAYTIITDITSINKDNLTKAYGAVSACFSLGFIIGTCILLYFTTSSLF